MRLPSPKNLIGAAITAFIAAGFLIAINQDTRRMINVLAPRWSWQNLWAPDPNSLRQSAAVVNLNQLLPESSHLWQLNETQLPPDSGILAQYQKYYRKVIEYYPQLSEANTLLAFCSYHRGNVKEAIAHYQASIETMPQFFWPYYDLGVIFLKEGKRREAAVFFSRAMAVKPEITLRAILGSKLYQQILLGHNISAQGLSERLMKAREECNRLLLLLQVSDVSPSADFIQSLRIKIL